MCPADPIPTQATSLPDGLPGPETAGAGITRLAPLMRSIDVPGRWALLVAAGWVFWKTRQAGGTELWPWGVGGYALLAVGATLFWLTQAASAHEGRAGHAVAYVTFVLDAIFASALIWRDGGPGSPLYLLLLLLTLKATVLGLALPAMVWLPFGFGGLYVLALWLWAGNLAFLADAAFLGRYLLLWLMLVGSALLAWDYRRRGRQLQALDLALAQQGAVLAQKTEVLQRTATDLGDRVLELRSLQEAAKALATTLRTEEALQVIVERLREVTGSSHCAVALVEEAGRASGSYLEGTVAAGGSVRPFRVPLAGEPPSARALAEARILHVGREDRPAADPGPTPDTGLTPLGELLGRQPYVIAPLVLRGQATGALYLAKNPKAVSEGKTEQFISSFAYFAATAIENARLYQDAWEKRRELEAVLAGIGDGVVVVDPDLHLILMNPVAQHILGLAAEPAPGASLLSYLAAPSGAEGADLSARGRSGEAFAALLSETLRAQREIIRELELIPGQSAASADGVPANAEPRVYGALASPVLDADGQVSGVVAVLRDITTQKELERMKSNFLSVVSHELRTPLHSIKGFVEIILMGKTGPVTELQEDFLRTVRGQTTVLQRMIDDLLEFSRMEAGRVKLHLSEVSLPAVAHAVAVKLAPLAEEGHLRLFVDLSQDLPEIDGDRVRLEQVLTNLVENAIKFTPAGGEIGITGHQVGDHVRLIVSDTGIGVPADEQDKIFDRFYQVDGSERRAYRGAGLGLSICKHIIERHGGRIWVESEGIPGRGSRFYVELPIETPLTEAPIIDFTTPSPRVAPESQGVP